MSAGTDRDLSRMIMERQRMHGRTLGILLLVVLGTGCASRAPISSLANDTTPERIGLNQFVGFFAIRLERAADDIARTSGDAEIARSAVLMKMRVIPVAQSALLIADNQAASIQLWVIAAALAERVSGDMGKHFGDGQAIAVDAGRDLEKRASQLASGLLTAKQFKVCKEKVETFVKEHVSSAGLEYTPEEAHTWSQSMSSVLEKPLDIIQAPLSSLNPTSGLSDTAQAIQHFSDEFSRARKEMNYLPSVLRWNTELLLMEMEESSKFNAMLDSVTQVGDSATSLAETAKDLPASLRKELTTFAEDLGKPQTELQETLKVANTTLTNTQQTAQSVDAMGSTLTGTLGAFNELMGTFGLGDDAAPEEPEPPPTPAEQQAAPYDINDYGRTAEKVTLMADALNGLLAEANTLTNPEQPPALFAETAETTHKILTDTEATTQAILADAEARTRAVLEDTEATTRSVLEDTETRTRSVLSETGVLARSLVDRIFFWAAALVVFTALIAFIYRVALSRRSAS